ncbi:response regulator [Paraflavitalea sp. CAU 1676]|uniref:response regulator n=1 Tax=Paraflavitalea sp. CAU 1676 TaxID=3032598 RepID=UPI0023DB347D|nr:response regulator [Paraflavitalea sp. CAU 1676]MDF2190543.1 response regulator [Paraflavitalea sp. CAU 1676]
MKRYHLLVVDDDLDDHELIRFALSQIATNIIVEFATSGLQALNWLGYNYSAVDMILLDLNMPVMNGVEFLQRKQSLPDISEIPVIIHSTNIQIALKERVCTPDVKKIITKASSMDKFIENLNEALQACL